MRDDENDQRAGNMEQSHPAPALDVACPFCRSQDVEQISLFGGQLSTDQYYCRACHTYFERFVRDDEGMEPS